MTSPRSHCAAPYPGRARHRRRLSAGLTGLVALCALLGASPARPQGQPAPVYDVEVIVFANPGGAREEPGASSRGPRVDGGDRASGAAQQARLVARLPAARLKLAALRDKLAASGYRVLAHGGWSQVPGSWGSRSSLDLKAVGIEAPGLTGQVQLERGSYLHLGFALRLAPAAGGSPQELVETRRVKFNERHYYDHPALGVIAVVSPPATAGR